MLPRVRFRRGRLDAAMTATPSPPQISDRQSLDQCELSHGRCGLPCGNLNARGELPAPAFSPLANDGGGVAGFAGFRKHHGTFQVNQRIGTSEMRNDSRSLAKAILAMSAAPASGRRLGGKVLARRELCLVPTTGALFVTRRLLKSTNAAGERTAGAVVQAYWRTSLHADVAGLSQQVVALPPRAAHVSALSSCAFL